MQWPIPDKEMNALDGNKTYEVYVPPKGQENNWIQTIPKRGWNMLFRVYGPLDPWFDKTRHPGDPEAGEAK